MDSEGNSDDPIYYVLDYASEFLEPDSDAEARVGLSGTESLAFIHSLAVKGMKIEEDGSTSKIVDSTWNTRVVVRELYREIVDIHQNGNELIEEGVSPEDIISYQKHEYGLSMEDEEEEWLNELSIIDEFGDFCENLIAEKLSQGVLPFFAISQVLIESYCIELIDNEIISDFYTGNENTIEFLQELSQPTREQLIQRTELLKGHEVSKMTEVRKTRNNIIHSLHGVEHWDSTLGSIEDVNKCIDTIIALESAVGNNERFQWRDDAD